MLVLRVLKARKELQVNQDQRGHKVSGVARVHLVQEVNQDHKVLERKETKVLLENLVFPELWDQSVQKAYQEPQGMLGHQANRVCKDFVERQECQGRKVTGGFLDFRVPKVNQVIKVPGVCQVMLVYLGCPGQLERRDLKDQWVCLDQMVQKAQEETRVLLDLLDLEVLLDRRETLASQVNLDFKGRQELQEIQDALGSKVNQVIQEGSLMQLDLLLWVSQAHQGPLVLLALQDLPDYQVPLVLLACLVKLVLKVRKETRESQEYQ